MKPTTRARSAALIAAAAAAAVSVVTLPSTSADAREAPAPTVLARHLVSPLSFAVSPLEAAFVAQNFGGPIIKVRAGHDPAVVVGGHGEVGGVSRRGRTLTFTLTGEGGPDEAVSYVKTFEDGVARRIGNLGRRETNRNPDGDAEYGFTELSEDCASQIDPETFGPPVHNGIIESHPYGSATIGDTTYVADAAANVVWEVTNHHVRALSVLPPMPGVVTADLAEEFGLPDCTVGETHLSEPVPTDVEVGRDGMLYVSTLAGEFPGAGAVFAIDPADGTTTQVVEGLSTATGLAVAWNGDIYVAMLFPGLILRAPAGGGEPEVFAEINQPAALEIRNGNLYATVDALVGLGFKQRQVPFAPRDDSRRAGPNGKLVRWPL